MTLPDDRIFELLRDEFVLVYRNIEREEHCGDSHGYSKHQTAVSTTNGAGAHNVQMFVLSPDRVVLHALPGYWHPDDLQRELRFAQTVHALWNADGRTRLQKEVVYRHLHQRAIDDPCPEMRRRSSWQPFDRWTELAKGDPATRDTFLRTASGELARDAREQLVPKPVDQLVHERMARQPFVPLERFDTATFVDFGQLFYDLNRDHDDGRTFRVRARWSAKHALERRRAERRRAD